MIETPAGPKGPWEDHWNTPEVEDLLHTLLEPANVLIPQLLDKAREQVADLQCAVVWHGSSWKWTLQYSAPNAKGEPEVLFYFVPNPAEPLISVPLLPAQLEHLPIRRLNRYIRDGLRGAKWGVDIRWARWTPSQPSEIEHLADLLKRKGKILLGESPSQKRKAS